MSTLNSCFPTSLYSEKITIENPGSNAANKKSSFSFLLEDLSKIAEERNSLSKKPSKKKFKLLSGFSTLFSRSVLVTEETARVLFNHAEDWQQHGKFKQVFLSKNLQTGEVEAVASIIARTAEGQALIARELSNLQKLQELKIPGIAKMNSYLLNEHEEANEKKVQELFLFLEYGECGKLSDCLKQQNKLSQSDRHSILTQLVTTCQALHAQGYCHRDIKSDNVVIRPATPDEKKTHGGNFTALLIDFASLCKLEEKELGRINLTTPACAPPECAAAYIHYKQAEKALSEANKECEQTTGKKRENAIKKFRHAEKAVQKANQAICETAAPEQDIWALGCIAYELFQEQKVPLPWREKGSIDLCFNKLSSYGTENGKTLLERELIPLIANYPHLIRQFILLSLVPKVEDRPLAQTLLPLLETEKRTDSISLPSGTLLAFRQMSCTPPDTPYYDKSQDKVILPNPAKKIQASTLAHNVTLSREDYAKIVRAQKQLRFSNGGGIKTMNCFPRKVVVTSDAIRMIFNKKSQGDLCWQENSKTICLVLNLQTQEIESSESIRLNEENRLSALLALDNLRRLQEFPNIMQLKNWDIYDFFKPLEVTAAPLLAKPMKEEASEDATQKISSNVEGEDATQKILSDVEAEGEDSLEKELSSCPPLLEDNAMVTCNETVPLTMPDTLAPCPQKLRLFFAEVTEGNVTHFIKNKMLSSQDGYSIIRQLLTTLAALHSTNHVFRELTPEKILLRKATQQEQQQHGGRYTLRIKDVTSVYGEKDGSLKKSLTPSCFISPEYATALLCLEHAKQNYDEALYTTPLEQFDLRSKKRAHVEEMQKVVDSLETKESDLWAFGCIAYELFRGDLPTLPWQLEGSLQNSSIACLSSYYKDETKFSREILPLLQKLPALIQKIISNTLQPMPKARLSAKELLNK